MTRRRLYRSHNTRGYKRVYQRTVTQSFRSTTMCASANGTYVRIARVRGASYTRNKPTRESCEKCRRWMIVKRVEGLGGEGMSVENRWWRWVYISAWSKRQPAAAPIGASGFRVSNERISLCRANGVHITGSRSKPAAVAAGLRNFLYGLSGPRTGRFAVNRGSWEIYTR